MLQRLQKLWSFLAFCVYLTSLHRYLQNLRLSWFQSALSAMILLCTTHSQVDRMFQNLRLRQHESRPSHAQPNSTPKTNVDPNFKERFFKYMRVRFYDLSPELNDEASRWKSTPASRQRCLARWKGPKLHRGRFQGLYEKASVHIRHYTSFQSRLQQLYRCVPSSHETLHPAHIYGEKVPLNPLKKLPLINLDHDFAQINIVVKIDVRLYEQVTSRNWTP
jgi:hypothetical protein